MDSTDQYPLISGSILKSEPTSPICQCCLMPENDLKSMHTTYYFDGKPEVYCQMIHECFALEIITNDSEELTYQICDFCITRLRDACIFKNQVESAQDSIQKSYKNKNATKEEFNKDLINMSMEDVDDSFDPDLIKHESEDEYLSFFSKKSNACLKEKSKKRRSKKNVKEKSKSIITLHKRETLKYEDDDEGEQIKGKHKIQKEKKRFKDNAPYRVDKNALTCEICNETFPVHITLIRHMSVHFPNHICHICARLFTTEVKLKSHVLRHKEATQVLTCEVCNKTYRGSSNLKKHMRNHLGPNLIYKCPQCSERFSSYYKRTRHLIDAHNDEEKKYRCKYCPKRYFQAGTLSRHRRRVHLQERTCICQECGDAFFDKSALTEHMLKHTGIKNYQCEVCHKSYGRRYTLIEHMKIHTNDKRFVCPECGVAFTQKCTLKGHMKTHEKLQAPSQIPALLVNNAH